jgi:hypothetical protein
MDPIPISFSAHMDLLLSKTRRKSYTPWIISTATQGGTKQFIPTRRRGLTKRHEKYLSQPSEYSEVRMEPRWYNQAYSEREDLRFIGGVGRFDLWLFNKRHPKDEVCVRVVTGHSPAYWDTIEFIGPNKTWPRFRHNEDKVKPNLFEYRMILRFAKVFGGLPLREFEDETP